VHLPVRKTLRVKYIAAEIHALLFISIWVFDFIFSQPLLNGPSAGPFVVILIADLPISFVAFAVMFTSASLGMVAAIVWGVLGTLWWFAIGIAIDRRVRSYRENRAGPTTLFSATTAASPVANPGKELLIASGVVAFILLASVAGKWKGSQGRFEKGEIRGFSFSPDGQSIVFVRSQGDSSHLEKVTLNSGTSAPIGNALPCMASSPTYSSDGARIGFACETKSGGLSSILIVDADGRNLHPLFSSNSDNSDFAPHFTPQGNEIYFGRVPSFMKDAGFGGRPPRRWDLYSASLDGHNPRKLTDRNFEQFGVSFSADGKMFVISGGVAEGSRLSLYSLDDPGMTAHAISLAVPNGAQMPVIDDVTLASDGQSIYFMAASNGKKGFDYDVDRADPTGKSLEKFTNANGYATALAVSADGKTAAFLKWTSRWGSLPNLSRLYVLDFATKQAKPLDVTGTANP
jgi:Tol biopolymer transport system component